MTGPGDVELLPGTSFGHYVIEAHVGAGGMGDVYAAVHKTLGKRVAIKVLRSHFLDEDTVVARFVREGKLASRLRHPHIVDVTDASVIDGVPCLAMELLEGESLAAKIKRDGRMSITELVDFALPIIAALDYAHEQGVVHRDIKPGNVFLARGWNGEVVPKLLDFGISKSLTESAASAVTKDTAFIGTPQYAAPEVFGDGEKPTPRADQYSFGVVLYEAATGAKPFDQSNGIVVLAKDIVCGNYRRPRELVPDLPDAFERAVRRAMSVAPEDRYPTARALGAALVELASERVRVIWEPVFAPARRLDVTGETNIVGLVSPGRMPTAASSVAGTTSLTAVTVAADDAPPPSGTMLLAAPARGSPSGPAMASERTVLLDSSSYRSLPALHATSSYPFGATASAPGVVSPPGPPRSQGAFLAVALGCAVLAALVGVALIATHVSSRGRAAAAASAPASAPALAPAEIGQPRTFTIAVQVVPETATIEVDGAAVGTGWTSQSLVRDGRKHTLRLAAPGYEPLVIEFDETRPPPPHVMLRAVDGDPSAAARSAPPPGTRPGPTARPGSPKPGSRTDNIDPWE